jgi:tetratricopeptide (TPR) repeat protein
VDDGMKLFVGAIRYVTWLSIFVLFAGRLPCSAQGGATEAQADYDLQHKKYADACAEYQQVLNGQPTNVPLLLKYSQALEGKGDLDAAILKARQATQVLPSSVDAHVYLGHYLDANRDEQGAALQYERILDLKSPPPARKAAYGPLIRLLNKLKDRKKLLFYARQFVYEFPDDPISHYDLAWAFTQIESEKAKPSYNGAIKEYRKALTANGDLAAARYNLAALLVKEGRHDEAIKELEIFVSKAGVDDPDMGQAQETLKKLKSQGH